MPLLAAGFFKGTVMQIEKALINDGLSVSKGILKISHSYLKFCSNLPIKFILLKGNLHFNSFYCLFCLKTKFAAQWLKI